MSCGQKYLLNTHFLFQNNSTIILLFFLQTHLIFPLPLDEDDKYTNFLITGHRLRSISFFEYPHDIKLLRILELISLWKSIENSSIIFHSKPRSWRVAAVMNIRYFPVFV